MRFLSLCLGAGALACSPAPPQPVPGAAPWIRVDQPKRHAVLVVIDTLRAEAVASANTPTLDALAEEGDSVPRAWSGSTWTVPSMISMFTGLPVRAHGWDFPFPRFMDHRLESYPAIPDDLPLLAEVLQKEGFRTDGLYANAILRPGLGFERGFDTWTPARDRQMADKVKEVVEGWSRRDRHFLYVHFKGPHHPLKPSRAAARRNKVLSRYAAKKSKSFPLGPSSRSQGYGRNYKRAYKAVVEDTDARLAAVLEALSSIADDAVIVVTSDHGELLGEQGEWGHEHWVWEPLTQVPFVASGLGELPETLNTTSVPALISAGVGVDHPWPSAGTMTAPIVSQRQGKLALSPDGVAKGIWDPEAHEGVDFVTYNLETDPTERDPTLTERAKVVAARARWEARVPGVAPLGSVAAQMDDEMLQMLGELGYMGDEGAVELAPPATGPAEGDTAAPREGIKAPDDAAPTTR